MTRNVYKQDNVRIFKLEDSNGHKYIGTTKYTYTPEQYLTSIGKTANSLISKAMAKYGRSYFTCELLMECKDWEAPAFRAKYINEYGSMSPAGYNQSRGGNKCIQKSPFIYRSGRHVIELNSGWTYHSTCEAAAVTGCSESNIRKYCNGERRYRSNPVNEWHWLDDYLKLCEITKFTPEIKYKNP